MSQRSAARRIARATSSPVPGCGGCPFTLTGQPAAKAEAVSPPATEQASGKFDAPNTATGPSATLRQPKSGRGSGAPTGPAGPTVTSSHPPSPPTEQLNRVAVGLTEAISVVIGGRTTINKNT